ncbi:hypothetical protein [Mycobacteroides franklinii]|uniref:hypothetical protein n=1 Tax=Mycobacteroides franklinii TaxID=948102 RepID=UPI001F1D023C|nr:hypothetical protein [Mycobacteroides franklinii]
MSFSLADLERAKVQSSRDLADALDIMAGANRDMKQGVERLPIAGDAWQGVSGDAAHHQTDVYGKYLGGHAEAQHGAAGKIRRAADEFEGVQQLLKKIENDAASGKFTINLDTGEVTPPSGKYDKNELDYLTSTLKQIRAAGETANADLTAAIKAAKELPEPSGSTGALPLAPGSAIKPNGSAGALQNLAAPNPDGDPGATKAAAATGADTEAKYKEWYPKNGVSVGDKSVDPSKLGGVGALPGVGNIDKAAPAKLAPTLADRDVPAFKDITRQNLQRQGVPADQIEQRVNDAVTRAQTPHFAPDGGPMRSPGEVPLHNSVGDQFNDIVGRANDSATKTIDGQIEQGKILTGQAGPGAPGVADAWKDVGLGAAKQVHELMTDPLAAPKMGIQEAQDFYHHPGESIGKNIILGTEGLATGAIGGEAAAGARGLLGDATIAGRGGLLDMPGLPHDTSLMPGHAHVELPSVHPGPIADHPIGGDHGGGLSGDHLGGGIADVGGSNGLPFIDMSMKDGWSDFQHSQMQDKVQGFNASLGDEGFSKTLPGVRDPAIRQLFLDTLGLDRVPPGVHVDHIRDLQAGGLDSVDNMGLLDGSVNSSFGSQLNSGMNRYPEGTQFGGVRLPDPGP